MKKKPGQVKAVSSTVLMAEDDLDNRSYWSEVLL
jgi:hypothetical protein